MKNILNRPVIITDKGDGIYEIIPLANKHDLMKERILKVIGMYPDGISVSEITNQTGAYANQRDSLLKELCAEEKIIILMCGKRKYYVLYP